MVHYISAAEFGIEVFKTFRLQTLSLRSIIISALRCLRFYLENRKKFFDQNIKIYFSKQLVQSTPPPSGIGLKQKIAISLRKIAI